MSRRLLLLRHAAAEFSGGGDHQRPLSVAGRDQARAQGAHMLAAGLIPQTIICSSALRTQTTAELLLAQWGEAGESIDVKVTDDIYHASPVQVLNEVQSLPPTTTAGLVIGHEPTMSMLAATLAGPESDSSALHQANAGFMTAGLGILDFETPWKDLAAHTARLRAIVPPPDN